MKPKPSPLTVPFAHWQLLKPSSLIGSSVTTAKYLHNRLVCGLHSGEIIVFERPDQSGKLAVRTRLLGHFSPIVAVELLTLRSESGLEWEEEEFLLALSRDGQLTKWSLKSGRCLQSIAAIIDPRPLGLKVFKTTAKEGDNGGRWLTTTYLLLYGCTTEIVVLNAFTLATVVLWTGNVDWPIPISYQNEGGVAQVLTILSNGDVQGWIFDDGLPPAVNNDFRTRFNAIKAEFGDIIHVIVSRQPPETRYVVVQKRGLSVWGQNEKVLETADWKLVYQTEFETEKFAALGKDSSLITTWDAYGNIEVLSWDLANEAYRSINLSPPRGTHISTVTPPNSLKDRIVAFSSSLRENRAIVSEHDLETILASNNTSSGWLETNDVIYFAPPGKEAPLKLSPKCSSSAIFCNMLVYASGKSLSFYTLPDFLLRFNNPSRVLEIPDCTGSITLLKTVRVHQIGTFSGKKEYLVLGTSFGEVRIVESGTLTISARLSLSTVPLNSAFKLSPDLGRRLRDTLLVTALDGTVGIIDVERAKIMVVFPGHDLKDVVKFGIRPGHNSVNIEYSDGVKREWEIGEEECGNLVSPASSVANSKPSSREGPPKSHPSTLGTNREVLTQWKWTVVADYWKEDEDRFDVENGKVFSIAEIPSRRGLPTAAINVRHILQHIEYRMAANAQLPEDAPKDYSYLENAKSLILALWPPARQFIDFNGSGEEINVDQCPTLGQIGANANISLLSPVTLAGTAEENEDGSYCGTFDISPTVSAIGLLVVYLLAQIILEAKGNKSALSKIESELLKKTNDSERMDTSEGFVSPSLAVASKFWLDPEERIMDAARIILNRYVSGLSLDHKLGLVKYWKEFLPIRVVPQLFHAKQVPRATILLTEIYVNSAPNTLPEDLGPAIGASLARLLTEPTTPYYQYLAATLLSNNFIHFQNCLPDATTSLHHIIHLYPLSPTLIFPLLQTLSHQNYPLLTTSLSSLLLPAPKPTHHNHHPLPAPPSPLPTFQLTRHLITTSPPPITLIHPLIHALALTLESAHHTSHPPQTLRDLIHGFPSFLDDLSHTYPTFSYSPYSGRLAISLSPGDLKIYDFSTSSRTPSHPVYKVEGAKGWVTHVCWDAHGRYLAGWDEAGGEVCVWRIGGGFFEGLGGGEVGGVSVGVRERWRFEGVEAVEWGEGKVVIVKTGEGEKRVTVG